MRIGSRFREFSFTCLELDTKLDGEPISSFCDVFQQCARESA